MDKFANAITDYYVRKNMIDKEKREIYLYGFKLIIADIINYTLIAVIGIILNVVLESVVFLGSLCVLRQFTGGYHAKTFWSCRLSMVVTYLCVMLVSEVVTHTECLGYILSIIDILCILFISLYAPVEHPNKPLSDEQKHSNKNKAIITSVFLTTASIFFVATDIKLGVTISITLLSVIILMIISMASEKGGEKNV